ncbi:hypothetical protein acdb102_17310 [Acidothermaceae bacterium B102]|nr:hypothetical protein acdb102_17310 [Acidothermaceae bacterium B102]
MIAGRKVRGHLLWMLMPAYTFGLLAFVPLVYAAVRLRRTEVWLWAGGFVLADVAIWLCAQASQKSALNTLGGALAITAAIVGTVQTARLRQELFEPRPPTT